MLEEWAWKLQEAEEDKVINMLLSLIHISRHVKPCGKQGGPPPKAKYYLMTDSEAVP